MGRNLGAFDNPEELDRPDLNKCPDCQCFFSGDSCPLCGKICPEEMRAGNRKPPKKEKKRRSQNSGRVIFIDWYHRWWFITLMMFFMPIVGIILLATSPHSKKAKITFIVLGIIYFIISTIGIGTIIGGIIDIFDPPVNTRLSHEEYVAKCESTAAENVWREPEAYKNKYVKLTVTISSSFEVIDAGYSADKYTKYYVCRVEGINGELLIRNCIQSGASNFAVGDTLTVYGEGDGTVSVFDYNYNEYNSPCVNAAYATLVLDENN